MECNGTSMDLLTRGMLSHDYASSGSLLLVSRAVAAILRVATIWTASRIWIWLQRSQSEKDLWHWRVCLKAVGQKMSPSPGTLQTNNSTSHLDKVTWFNGKKMEYQQHVSTYTVKKIQNTQRSTELITSLGAIPGAGGVQISIGLNSGPATWVTRTCSGHWTWAGVNPVLMRSSRAALNFGASIALQLFAPYWFIQVPQVPCQLPATRCHNIDPLIH